MRQTRIAFLLAAATALPAASGDEGSRRNVVEQKAALVQRVLQDSAIARRVAAGGSDAARAQLARAAEAHRLGLALVADGNLAASEAAIDEAMAAIGAARRLAPLTTQLSAEQRTRFAAHRDSTEATLAAVKRQAAGSPGADVAAEVERGVRLIALAAELASAERHEEALRTLYAADGVLLDAMKRTLGSKTLDYTVRFDSPQEELRYETERYGSYHRLVPVALANLRPPPAAIELVDKHVRTASRQFDAAVARSSRGELAAAIETLREAIDYLQQALRAAGLALPAQ